MTAVLLFVGAVTLVGIPIVRLLDRSLSGGSLAGISFLCGSGLIAYVLLFLAIARIPWSRPLVFLVAVGAALIAVPGLRRGAPKASPGSPFSWPSRVIDLLTALVMAGHAVYATAASIPEWDFWAIWGLKGKVFFLERGIDWAFLRDPDHIPMHPDYPVLLPLLLAAYGIFAGAWEDRWAGLIFTAFGAAVLLLARRSFREDQLTPLSAALATLGLTGCALTWWVGMAEAPLIAFSGAGLLLLRRGINADQAHSIRAGAVMLGFGAATKNEGLAFLIAAAIALTVSSPKPRRDLLRLWPAAAIALPWLIIRLVLRLETVLFSGPLMDRARERLWQMGELLTAMREAYIGRPLFWAGILAAIVLLAFSGRLRRERFLMVACLLQLGFYFGSYLMSYYDVAWHIAESWPRLIDQVSLPLGYLAFVHLFLLIQQSQKERFHEREPDASLSTG